MQNNHQIVISGVGGQGVLFVTRLMAEAAIANGLPVFTSETHGMAQRGGTVISHLKVGDFSSPLINPARADGIMALKAECMEQHGGYLKPGGWAAVNAASPMDTGSSPAFCHLDADRIARDIHDPRSVNLIMLGFTLSRDSGNDTLFCSLDDIEAMLEKRLQASPRKLKSALHALRAGAAGPPMG
jgi:indolepyruvate ferredoxin oxidoreductase beta subunit